MGNTATITIANATDVYLDVEVWIAGQPGTKKTVRIQDNSECRISLNSNSSDFRQIRTIIAHVQNAYRAVAENKCLLIKYNNTIDSEDRRQNNNSASSSNDDKTRCITIIPKFNALHPDAADLWTDLQDGGRDGGKGMKAVTDILNVATKLGSGLAYQAVNKAMVTAGINPLAAYAGGQLASSLLDMGLQVAMKAGKAPEKSLAIQVEEAIETHLTQNWLLQIETALIGLCRDIQYDYMPLKRAFLPQDDTEKLSDDARRKLSKRLRHLMHLFTADSGLNIMPFLEQLKETQVSLPLYLTGVSLHLILLQEARSFAPSSTEQCAADLSFIAYLNHYHDNAQTLWKSIIDDHISQIKAVIPHKPSGCFKICVGRQKARLEVKGVTVYRISGFDLEDLRARMADIENACKQEHTRILQYSYNHPEETFRQWTRINCDEVKQTGDEGISANEIPFTLDNLHSITGVVFQNKTIKS